MSHLTFTTSGALRKSALREANDRLVLSTIRNRPGIARSEIGQITGLSPTSVTFVVRRLLRGGLILEEKNGNQAKTGRPSSGLRLRAKARVAIGIEIEKPDSVAVLVDLNGDVLESRKIGWEPNPSVFLDKTHGVLRYLTKRFNNDEVLGVGVSVPGTIDKGAGRVIAAENIGWFGVDVGRALQRDLTWPFYFEHDGNLAALAECSYAVAHNEPPLRYLVYIKLSGGLGTGVVVDGRPLHGVASASAEFGHVMLYPDGIRCSCGNRGCWEQYASEGALHRIYLEKLGAEADGADALSTAAIVERARRGEAAALEALRETAENLALGLVNICAVLNPEAIVLGEPLGATWDLVEETVWETLRSRVPPYVLGSLRIFPTRLGNDASVLGAAGLVLTQFFTRFRHTAEDGRLSHVSVESKAY